MIGGIGLRGVRGSDAETQDLDSRGGGEGGRGKGEGVNVASVIYP